MGDKTIQPVDYNTFFLNHSKDLPQELPEAAVANFMAPAVENSATGAVSSRFVSTAASEIGMAPGTSANASLISSASHLDIGALLETMPRALRRDEATDSPSPILVETQAYGTKFVRWLEETGLSEKAGTSYRPEDLRTLFEVYQHLHRVKIEDFGEIDRDDLEIDSSVNLGIGKGYQNLGYGDQNHGVYRVRIRNRETPPLVVKLVPAEQTEYLLREVRNYAIISTWGVGPVFYGITKSPDGETVGIIMDEIMDGLNVKTLFIYTRYIPHVQKRISERTGADFRRIRHFLDLFDVHPADLDALITPDGSIHIIDPAEFEFFKKRTIFPDGREDFDYNNLEALLLAWILNDIIDPCTLPFRERVRIRGYILERHGPNASNILAQFNRREKQRDPIRNSPPSYQGPSLEKAPAQTKEPERESEEEVAVAFERDSYEAMREETGNGRKVGERSFLLGGAAAYAGDIPPGLTSPALRSPALIRTLVRK